jgi:hypothetical protein
MQYEVIVTGAMHCADHVRTYTLKATSERLAAQDALEKFEDEMECLYEEATKDN